ncbi:MAG: hypothetical protein ACMG6E_07950, partial [Candidatus Roizmanbacteria bacterium]
MLLQHSVQLRTQITSNDEKSKQDRLDYLEEGRKVRQKIEQERQKIQAIKNKKIDELTNLSIP